MPTGLHLAASLSADPLNFAIPALLVATCVRCRFDPSVTLTPWRRGLVAVLVVVTGLLKMPYIIFGAALFLIPSRCFENSRNRRLFIAGSLVLGLAASAIWNLAFPFVPGSYWGNGANPSAALALVFSDPAHVLGIMASTLSHWWLAWSISYYCAIGGGPGFAYFLPMPVEPIAGLLLALALSDDFGRRDFRQAAILAAIAASFLFALLLAFFVGYTRSGAELVEGMNGRYLFLFYLLAGWAIASVNPLGSRLRVLRAPIFCAVMAMNTAIILAGLHWFRERWIY